MNDKIRDALYAIRPHERETWVRLGMAVKSELGDSGLDLWLDWSRQDDKFRERDARAVWKSIKAAGGIRVGSLFAEAKRNGWTGEPILRDPIEEARWRARMAREDRLAAEEQERSHRAAAAKAVALLKAAALAPHPYLARKGFPDELGFVRGETLLVPMRSIDNASVLSVQSITAEGEKKFLPGGRARGAVMPLGSGPEAWLCEGYATGLSIYAALKSLYRNARVVVCFSAANIAYVASQLTGRRFVVADNDSSGTGQKYAEKTGLAFWMPPEMDSDANDFHLRHGLRSLAVKINETRSVMT